MISPSTLATLSLALLLASSAQSRTLHVEARGDENGDGTVNAPFGNPEIALREARDGDTVSLGAGRYALRRPLHLNREGVTLSSAPSADVLLFAPTDDEQVPSLLIVTASRITVSGLNLRGGAFYGVKIDVDETRTPTRGVTVRDCDIGGTGRDCIKTFNADQLLIEKCEIGPSGLRDASNAEGIDAIGSRGVTVRSCRVRDIATNGIYFKGGARDGVVEGCLIQNTGGAGVLLGQDTDQEFMRDRERYEARRCVARNNIVVNASGPGVGTYSGEKISFLNNTLVDVAREFGAGVWLGVNRRGVRAKSVSMRNNIVIVNGARPWVFALKVNGSPSAAGNLYSGTGNGFWVQSKKLQKLDFKRWRKISRETRSRLADPQLDAAKLFVPRNGSPAVDGGVAAGVVNDFNGRARFSGATFDVGAHELP